MTDIRLVPGRECGGCAECCHALSIDSPTLIKASGVTCTHSNGSGCRIHSVRPNICRAWFCGWRMSDTLGDEWRPDRCGIIVEVMAEGLPEGFRPPGIRFTLLRSSEDALWPPLVQLVTKALVIHQAVYLCLVGPPGHLAARTLLNVDSLVEAALAGDMDAIREGLRLAGKRLEAHHWERKSA